MTARLKQDDDDEEDDDDLQEFEARWPCSVQLNVVDEEDEPSAATAGCYRGSSSLVVHRRPGQQAAALLPPLPPLRPLGGPFPPGALRLRNDLLSPPSRLLPPPALHARGSALFGVDHHEDGVEDVGGLRDRAAYLNTLPHLSGGGGVDGRVLAAIDPNGTAVPVPSVLWADGPDVDGDLELPPPRQGCDDCGLAFAVGHQLREHIASAHGEVHACQRCPKVFALYKTLVRHQRVHTGVRSFECDLCHKMFVHRSNLRIHLRVHTRDEAYRCDECGRVFARHYTLVVHKRTHSGERPFECDLCPKRFINSSNLQAHVRSHTGEKPFVCEPCGKAFSSASYYTRHKRKHSGEMPFKCDVCVKTFYTNAALTRHACRPTATATTPPPLLQQQQQQLQLQQQSSGDILQDLNVVLDDGPVVIRQ